MPLSPRGGLIWLQKTYTPYSPHTAAILSFIFCSKILISSLLALTSSCSFSIRATIYLKTRFPLKDCGNDKRDALLSCPRPLLNCHPRRLLSGIWFYYSSSPHTAAIRSFIFCSKIPISSLLALTSSCSLSIRATIWFWVSRSGRGILNSFSFSIVKAL